MIEEKTGVPNLDEGEMTWEEKTAIRILMLVCIVLGGVIGWQLHGIFL